jgi:hypothetical protein
MRSVFAVAWLISSGIWWCAPVRAENRALIIGVSRYQSPELKPLPGVAKDVPGMMAVARSLGFGDTQIRVLQNEQATLANIRSAMRDWLGRDVGTNDGVLLYFSGHGSHVVDENRDETDGQDELLTAYDTRYVRDAAKKVVGIANVLVDDELGEHLRRIPSRNIIVIIDACHSGTVTRGVFTGPEDAQYPPRYLPNPALGDQKFTGDYLEGDSASGAARNVAAVNYVSLAAAQDNEPSRDTPDGGAFTLGIRRAVQQAARRGGPLTSHDLVRSAAAFIREILPPRAIHTPQLVGNPQLAAMNLLRQTPASPPGTPPAPPAPVSDGDATWSGLLSIAQENAARPVPIQLSKSVYRSGELLSGTIRIPVSGYLTILNAGKGENKSYLLLPNEQVSGDQKVEAGQTFAFPRGFEVEAFLPDGVAAQEVIVLAVVTPQPLRLERGAPAGIFREITPEGMRAFRVRAKQAQNGVPYVGLATARITR